DRVFWMAIFNRIELNTLLWIERGNFDHIAVLHIADRDGVIEINRSRGARRNVLDLNAGLRKHQHLGIGPDAEFLQQWQQISPWIALRREFDLAGFNVAKQLASRVLWSGFVVLNCLVIQVESEAFFQLLHARGGAQG